MRFHRDAVRCALALCCFALTALAPLGARADACGGAAGGIGGTGVQAPAPAPAPPAKPPGKGGKDRGGVGGTGNQERDRGGIGGTGISERDRGGIGGTGIVGVITGFGSVCVNGLEVAYDHSSRIDADGAALQADDLAVGQLVIIDAAARDGGLWAERLHVRNAAVGPVSHADLRRGEIEVLGQRVRVDATTQLVGDGGAGAGLGAFPPGSFVAVSGLRRPDGSVAATRIETTAPRERVSVSGPIAADGRGGAAIGGLEIVAAGDDAAAIPNGRATFVAGRLDAQGVLRADRIEPLVQFTPAPAQLSIEGFVQAAGRDGFRTDLVDVDASQLGASGSIPMPDTRVVVSGPVGADGRLLADRVDLVTPERPSPRGEPVTDEDRAAGSDAAAPAGAAGGERPATAPTSAIETPAPAETPEPVEAPEVETPEIEAPEVERPETPEIEHETPEIERPEIPEVEHETPEPPEIPEVEAPERPEIPEIETPEPPERPEIPEIERPEAPERPEPVERPELPEVERPETPERVEPPERPELPEIEKPELPEYEKPEAPELPERPETD